MGWLDRLRRGGAKEDQHRLAEPPPAPARRVAVIGLDGVGLPAGAGPDRARDHAATWRGSRRAARWRRCARRIPTISSVSWTGFMTGKNPGKHGVYGFTDLKPGTMTHVLPELRQRARRHAVGRRGAGGQALHRAEHPEHVPGAAAARPPGVRLRRGQPRARRLPAGAAAAPQRRRLQDRRRLRERRPASRRTSSPTSTRRSTRAGATYLELLRERALGPLHRRHHRVRPPAPLLLEPVRRSVGAASRAVPRLLPPARRRARASWSRPCRRTSRSSWWPITGIR